jgi:hypothetical protein
VRRGQIFGADDQMHAGRRECVEPSRHCRLHRGARAGRPDESRLSCSRRYAGLAPSRHARINSIAAMIEKQRFRLLENTRQRSSNWSASAAGRCYDQE